MKIKNKPVKHQFCCPQFSFERKFPFHRTERLALERVISFVITRVGYISGPIVLPCALCARIV